VLDGEQSLLARRAEPPYRGAWDIPGGHCGEREHPAAAAVRECHEEIGYGLAVIGFLGGWSHPRHGPSVLRLKLDE